MSQWHRWLIGLTLLSLLTACGGPRSMRLPPGAEGQAVLFSPDGSALLALYRSGDAETVEYRGLPDGRTRWRMEGLPDDLSAAFVPNGQTPATVCGRRVVLWEAAPWAATEEVQ